MSELMNQVINFLPQARVSKRSKGFFKKRSASVYSQILLMVCRCSPSGSTPGQSEAGSRQAGGAGTEQHPGKTGEKEAGKGVGPQCWPCHLWKEKGKESGLLGTLSDFSVDRANSLKPTRRSFEAKITVMVNFKCQFTRAQYPYIRPNIILNVLSSYFQPGLTFKSADFE